MAAPTVIRELIERFNNHLETYCSAAYNEAQLREEFLNPFFEALGWDVYNRKGYADAYKEVIHEAAIKVGGRTKAPDYCFRAGGGKASFFVEAKKPAVDVGEAVSPAYQLRRYAWSAKLPLSLLSDFATLAVYDCRIRPVNTDKATTARVLHFSYREYVDRWDELHGLLSPEAVRRGALERFVGSKKVKKGTAEVDAAFLTEIETWRDVLARNIALRNERLEQRDLNFAVQRTLDRMVFLRICEDRGIEPYGTLQGLINGSAIYRRLAELFQRADERYNSGLFHFTLEKDRAEPPDELTLALTIDDKPLKDIIQALYYPESPYEFSVLPAEILGQVYEQFLGKVIRLTKGHQAKVEEKPEVRKAGGVYYTPAYIVEYIVEHTVGKLLEKKTPAQAAKLRILDPACGSGSFLIGAYQRVLDWHRDRYVAEDPEKHARGRNPRLYRGAAGDWRLTTAERKRILLNNVYGVDIDPQAVEVTKLSLLLKVLEGESKETVNNQLRLFHERALPDLGRNIKCGNSLIGPDFYRARQTNFLDDEDMYRINAFDWEAEFPEILRRECRGFDAVIGNPPWGAEFSESEKDYLRDRHQRVIARMIDSYMYFLDRAMLLAKNGSPIGLIIPSTVRNQVDAKPLRRLLLDRGVAVLVNVGEGVFGSKVLNTSTILISCGQTGQGHTIQGDVSSCPLEDRPAALRQCRSIPWSRWHKLVKNDPQNTFFTGNLRETLILQRLRRSHGTFRDIVQGAVERGVSPDVAQAHVVTPSIVRRAKLEKALLRWSVSGTKIKRYHPWNPDQLIIYTTRETRIKQYPMVCRYLAAFKGQNTCKEVRGGAHPWWALHRARDPQIFESPKFIGLTTTKSIEVIYDVDSSVYVTDAMYVFKLRPGFDPWTCMGVIQSRAFLFLYRVANQGELRVIPQVKASKLYDLPYPVQRPRHEGIVKLVEGMLSLHKRLPGVKTEHEKTVLKRQIETTDRQIDQLVYDLYGLSDDEVRVVEEATT